MHDQPPVAELVAEPLDDHRAVVRDVAGGLPLLVEVGDEVGGGPGVQARRGDAFLCLLLWKARQLAGERAERAAQLGGTAEGVAVPERQLAGLAGAGETSTRSGVMSSMRHELAPRTNTSPTRDS